MSEIEEFARKYCDLYQDDPTLWENHTLRVREFAVKLAELEGADRQVVEIAALLHDIGKYKGKEDHHITSYELAKELLDTIDLTEEKKALILKCILKHRTRFSAEEYEIEVKVLQSADALGTLFDVEWQEYSRATISRETILKLYDKALRKINLESAKRIAEPQIEKLRKLLG